ncbi:hypothetical protein EN829_036315 [Mesorhizobium sp. M00.F.Ca.ET.186.01.1.1]|uniref:hypothetical protein n=1 Tax=Brevibacillus borstelensis TaxID=45462 RepID=UPI001137F3B9|nr:hypothetical protein [Brevibacillus borstelensis]MCM3590446.1 hypothetical protein [Brevibacillus borstelensis]TGV30600.1 hypothetical protein EN829_036315 [Mesorhizobium sp. M00.F.Ca.ET.186.01.1.1]
MILGDLEHINNPDFFMSRTLTLVALYTISIIASYFQVRKIKKANKEGKITKQAAEDEVRGVKNYLLFLTMLTLLSVSLLGVIFSTL